MSTTMQLTTCLAENTVPFCRSLAAFANAEVAQNFEFVNPHPWQERVSQIAAGSIQLAWICGLLFTRLKIDQKAALQVLAAPVMSGEDYADRPVYFSHIVVRQDSDHATFADLQGARWGYNEPGSFSGYTIVRHHLAKLGLKSNFFGAWIESGSHSNSLQLLLDGRIDATALDCTLLLYWLEKDPSLRKKIRQIGRLGPNPSPPLVVTTRLSPQAIHQLRTFFTTLHLTPAGRALLATSGVKRFTAVPEEAYYCLYEMSKV